MEALEIIEGLSANETKLLLALNRLDGKATPEQIFKTGEFGQLVEVMNAGSWLQSKGLIQISEVARKIFTLRSKDVIERGLPERRALAYISSNGGSIGINELSNAVDKEEASIALGWLRKKGLAEIKKGPSGTMINITQKGQEALVEKTPDEKVLERLAIGETEETALDTDAVNQLRTRQELISERLAIDRTMTITDLGTEIISLGLQVKEEVAQLTPEMIQSGDWRSVSIRKYDVHTFAPAALPGKKHPLSRIADDIRRIFIGMGFTEVDDEFVQPAFWNMDALFTPQDHPARELQDTFYLKHPSKVVLEDDDIVKKVCEVHESGGDTGSCGWRYKWCRDESERALLRTHTTVNSIRYLWKHPEPPVKMFTLSKVFRNEAIDATHLPEFTQIEGIVMEKDANFDMLCGIIKEFYKRMGFQNIRFRPGYFPYVEPSLEIEVEFKGSWMELGGAGVFRPEVTAPFGIKCPVLAWGFGFERLAIMRWGLQDVRDLYVSDVEMLRQSPIL